MVKKYKYLFIIEMDFLRSSLHHLRLFLFGSRIEQLDMEEEVQFVLPIPKPHKIKPIYFTLFHKYPQHPDILLKWIFTEISSMEYGWERLSANPADLSRELYEKAKNDVELERDIAGLNGSGWNCMIGELRNLTITGFPAKYLLMENQN
jgi:hypothetical protein